MTVFRGLDNNTREVVLEKHNQFRRKVAKGLENRGISSRVHGQPPAANMKELVVVNKSNNSVIKTYLGLEFGVRGNSAEMG